MSKGGKTKTVEKTNTEVALPEWMSRAGEGLYGEAKGWSDKTPVQEYPNYITAGMNDNLRGAGSRAQGDAGRDALAQARSMATGAAGGGVSAVTAGGPPARVTSGGAGSPVRVGGFDEAAASRHMSPFLSQVQDSTLRSMNRTHQQQRQALGDEAAASRTFGGTRHAVEGAELGRAQGDSIMDYIGRSNQAAFENAQGQFERDRSAQFGADTFNTGVEERGIDRRYNADTFNAGMEDRATDRRFSADTFNANMANTGLDRTLNAAGLINDVGQAEAGVNSQSIMDLLRTGGVQQDTENAQLGAGYNEFLRMQDAPMDRYRDLMAILAGTPRNVTTTGSGSTTSRNSPGWLSTAMGAGQIAASAYSDRRLKMNVTPLGEWDDRGDGLNRYSYFYKPDLGLPSGRQVGVMADEVAELRPWALGEVRNGYATVNYDALGRAA
jgi:hypothetical protein